MATNISSKLMSEIWLSVSGLDTDQRRLFERIPGTPLDWYDNDGGEIWLGQCASLGFEVDEESNSLTANKLSDGEREILFVTEQFWNTQGGVEVINFLGFFKSEREARAALRETLR